MTFVLDIKANRKQTHIIKDDQEAIAIAHQLASKFTQGASDRDREGKVPLEEVNRYSESGLWGITVPKEYGGSFVSNVTLAEVTKIISEADSSLGQIPQNHLYIVESIRLDGTDQQKKFYFDQVLKGKRFGNAFSEIGTKNVADVQTRVTKTGSKYLLNGRKFYSTGALVADWIPVVASNDDHKTVIVILERGTPGLTIIDDWNSFGQRCTGSGTTIIENVEVSEEQIILQFQAFERPTTQGPVAQIIQAAVDVGIAKAALKDTLHYVRNYARPWIDVEIEHGYEDPLTLYNIGQVVIQVHAAEALLRRSGEYIDLANANPTDRTVAEASIAVAEAKAIAAEASILASNKLFELAGTKSTLRQYNLDRHWRNARTHTLHDPARWKYYAVGNFYLNAENPPRHPWL
ncbi:MULTISPECIES: SfnB family sulfur acquisition oxidoreductase [Pseudanabaena]|uniref:Dibenzothiophene monooxygenase n=2 Tax=Pseudanabaena TaxID=1152 RepID=L8MXY5_9CYAN|nr:MULTISPECIES: SfnB family sulfur acquisition oxidoreductase [Pseudanabaena]ELS32867.1 Acyl-CoA dehydrogenase type 2 domain protein [Pseudanabaena biceps PCC 7429]MDG3494919.1 SfnB family sulfur acquisition oxidoreductase [Pseudanabaena catenata USMAC16]